MFSDVFVGTPPQKLRVIFDTGSSDVIVQGSGLSCSKATQSLCALNTRFHSKESSTFQKAPTFDLKYQAGKVSGLGGSDTVSFGGYEVEWVRFGELLQESKTIQQMRADGVLGLAFTGLSKITRPPLLASLFAQHQDEIENMFSVYISPGLRHDDKSKLIVGGYDLSLAGPNAKWHFTPVVHVPGYDEYTYWAVKFTRVDITYGGLGGQGGYSPFTSSQAANHKKDVSICSPSTSLFESSSGCFAIVDSGSGLTLVPKTFWTQFMDAIVPGACISSVDA
jgi:hypothetical protein